jgi:hypothetical protein
VELVTTVIRRNGRQQKVCRCKRYAFPHRYQRVCDTWMPEESDEYTTGPGRQWWQDYHGRVADLRREL